MADAKVQFGLGSLSFSGEGDQDWLEKQIDKFIEKAPALANVSPVAPDTSISTRTGLGHGAPGTLASFLSGAGANQVKRFLTTAEWLHRKGSNRISTTDVNRALKENNQGRLSNPSDCLRQNVAKGHVEKDGKQFFVTEEGRKLIGK